MTISVLTNSNEFEVIFTKAELLVLYFTAKWCGPCQQISPIIDQLSNSYSNINFLKIDIDEHKQLASRFSISSIPTFLFVNKGKELERVRGADITKLNEEINKLNNLNLNAVKFNNEVTINNEIKKYINNGFTSLNNNIFLNELEYMNVENGSEIKKIFNDEVSTINSDIDSQILIHIPLINVSKIHSILVKSKECTDDFQKPNLIKIWINNSNIISFDDASQLNSLNDLQDLEFNDDGFAELKLKFVRFQKVKTLDLFFDGDDEDIKTLIEKIYIIGVDGETVKQGTISKD